MRIVSYNILDGGEGRADPLAEVIQAQRPDVVALVEADVPATVERIARRLSMDFVVVPDANILRRFSVVGRSSKRSIMQRSIRPSLDHSSKPPCRTRQEQNGRSVCCICRPAL